MFDLVFSTLTALNQVATFVGALVFWGLGGLLVGAGVALFWVGVTAWRTGPMTWVVASLAVVHLLQKVRGIIAPKDKALPRSLWRELLAQMRDAGAQARNAPPVQRLEELTRLPEYRDKQIRQRAQLRRLAPFLVLAGIGLLALGVHQSRLLMRLQSSGMRAPGTVTSLISSRSSNGGGTYYPPVGYNHGHGRKVDFKDSTG